jgi:nucleoid-associated protein YgaU
VVQGRIWILGGGALSVAAVVVAWLALRFDRPVVELPEADRLSAAAPAAVSAPPVPASGGEVGVAEAQPEPPTFDVVRVATDGGALVAGRAAPGSAVDLLVDGVVVAQALADAAGQFVAIFALDPSAEPQVLSLAMVLADGASVPSEDVVVLAPRAAPEAAVAEVAEATPGDGGTGAEGSGGAESGPVAVASSALAGEVGGASAAPSPDAVGVAEPEAVAEGSVDEVPLAAVAEAAVRATSDPAEVGVASQVVAAAPGTADADRAPEVVAAASGSTDAGEAPAIFTSAPDIAADGLAPAVVAADSVEPQGAAAEGAVPVGAASVAAAAAPDFLLDRTGQVRVLDTARQALDNVVVDAIGYDADGSVQVSGRALQGAEGTALRIYLNNRPLAVARAQAGHWQLDLPDVAPGVYTLRVDELDGAGQVVSRFETPFLREDPVAVARLLAVPEGVGAGQPEGAGVGQGRAIGPFDQVAAVPAQSDDAVTVVPDVPDAARIQITAQAGGAPVEPQAAAPIPVSNGPGVSGLQAADAQARDTAQVTGGTAAAQGVTAALASAGGTAAGTVGTSGTASEAAATSLPLVPQPDASALTASGTSTVDNAADAEPTPFVAAPARENLNRTEPGSEGSETARTEEVAQTESAATDTDAGPVAASEADESVPVAPQPVATATGTNPASAAPPRVTLITVQPGQSLWRISHQHYGDGARYVQIFRANQAQIRNPNLIYPGQIFALPE